MTKEEYEAKLHGLNAEYIKKKKEIAWEFAYANRIADIGDILIDHTGSIIVEGIGLAFIEHHPICTYKGKNLIKSGKQSKREPIRTTWESNVNKVVRNGEIIMER